MFAETQRSLCKILFLGDATVGKTSIINQYVNRVFSDEYQPTVGADFKSRQLDVDGRFVTLQIWDPAGQEKYQSLCPSYYRDSDIVVFVYDMTNTETFEHVEAWLARFREARGDEQYPMLLLGNKQDCSDERTVSAESGSAFAEAHGMVFREVSAKVNAGISDACEEIVKAWLASGPKMSYVEEPVEEQGWCTCCHL